MVCGGKDTNYKDSNKVLEVKFPSFEVTEFPPMMKPHIRLKLATINSEIFAFVDSTSVNEQLGNSCTSVEIYSEETKTWKHQYVNFEGRFAYCLCSFMSKQYIICGCVKGEEESLSSCYIYNIKSNERNKKADLNQSRCCAACTVFEGKIVVTGGTLRSYSFWLKSVESYDYYENKWTYFLDMNSKRYLHASVSIGDKLFVIGGRKISSCEVFDRCSRKFTTITSEIKVSSLEKNYCEAFCVDSNIVE